jgi:hypothetical protein
MAIAVAAFLICSAAADGTSADGGSHTLIVSSLAGRSVDRAIRSEPAGVIRQFRVVAPAHTRVTVTAVIPGLARVTASVPRARFDAAEACTRHGGSVVCVQAEEACPMPAANWRIQVRKLAGPAGRIRIDFVVGAERAG